MTITPSELSKLFAEMAAEYAAPPSPPRKYECDCGRVYLHPDLLIECAQRGHK